MSEQQLITAQETELASVELQIAERKAELARLELKVEEQKTERNNTNAQANVAIAGLAVLAVLAVASRPAPKKRSLMQRVFG
jgi:hypothetical protein